MVYENQYHGKIADFGCIQHSQYSCIGASPDGINIDPNSLRYGRMIEVKNIVNREITDTPKEEYWIQMQIQMETCDLNECDFIETRFKLFETENDFYNYKLVSDPQLTSMTTMDHQISLENMKGVYLCFVENKTDLPIKHNTQNSDSSTNNSENKIIIMPTEEVWRNLNTSPPKWIYMPLNIPLDPESITEWIKQHRIKMRPNYVLFSTHYWYLDEFSCILVKRNKMWFESALPKILDIWSTITKQKSD